MLVAPTGFHCFYCDRGVTLPEAGMLPDTGKLACQECVGDLDLKTIPVID
jgi:hypothetical protein